jgi:acylphosphatase
MSGSEIVRVRLLVRGRVQGVGFRRFVLKQARNYPLGGWVRNNVDGTVEIEAIADSHILATFIEDIRRGSFLARVDEIEELVREKSHPGGAGIFTIRS